MAKDRADEIAKREDEEKAKVSKVKKEWKVYKSGVGKYIDPNVTKR